VFCENCGTKILSEKASYCENCGQFLLASPIEDITQDPVMRTFLPVGRSLLAIAAGYLGLFSFLIIPAPLAIVFGIAAIRDLKKNPKKLGIVRAWFGIIMGSIFIIIMLVFMLNRFVF
jgi:hypothetical protein